VTGLRPAFPRVRRPYLVLLALVASLLLGGAFLTAWAQRWPLYVAPDAPERLAAKLAGIKDPQEQMDAWNAQLPAFETPRKRYFDLGCGLAGFAAGLMFSARALADCLRAPGSRRHFNFRLGWMLSFLVPFAVDLWLFPLRYLRGDFPPWNDSISDFLTLDLVFTLTGWLLSSMLVTLFLGRRELPATLRWIRPTGTGEWLRLGFLLGWLGLLAGLVFWHVVYGDAGRVAGAMLQIVLLLVLIAAARRSAPAPQPAEA
jgi:hypothetical protein